MSYPSLTSTVAHRSSISSADSDPTDPTSWTDAPSSIDMSEHDELHILPVQVSGTITALGIRMVIEYLDASGNTRYSIADEALYTTGITDVKVVLGYKGYKKVYVGISTLTGGTITLNYKKLK